MHQHSAMAADRPEPTLLRPTASREDERGKWVDMRERAATEKFAGWFQSEGHGRQLWRALQGE
jgi:hypothetical protein